MKIDINKPDSKRWWIYLEGDDKFRGEINLHAEGQDYTPQSKGIWCSYLYIHERFTPPELFATIWLKPRRVKWSETSRERLDYPYTECPELTGLPFHGGITYYEQCGQHEGHRYIKVGCDWNHLWDQEGCFADIEAVRHNLIKVYEHWKTVVAQYETPKG